jgi:hypothetical protein
MRRQVAVVLLVGVSALVAARASADDRGKGNNDKKIAVRDDCDPADPAWAPTGGCTLRGGVVTFAEFGEFLISPLSAGSPVGHPAWRMDPTYVRTDSRQTIKVSNEGGRGHSFTEVADFGGGMIPTLNGTLTLAPECAQNVVGPTLLDPGAKLEVHNLAVGNHKFQCCIHPWMRMLVKVEADNPGDDHHHDH